MQVEAERVDARLDGEVRSDNRRHLGRIVLSLGLPLVAVGAVEDHLDACIDEPAVQVADPVRSQLALLEGGGDLLAGDVSALAAGRDQRRRRILDRRLRAHQLRCLQLLSHVRTRSCTALPSGEAFLLSRRRPASMPRPSPEATLRRGPGTTPR